MDVTRDELEARFRDMSDAELLERAGQGGLTDLAQDVINADSPTEDSRQHHR